MLKTSSFSTRFAYYIGFTALAFVSITTLSKTVWSSGTSSNRRSRKKRERSQLPVPRTIPNTFEPNKYHTKGLSGTLRGGKQRAGPALPYVEDSCLSDEKLSPISLLPSGKGKLRAGPSRPICTPQCEGGAYFSNARHNYTESGQDDEFLAPWDVPTTYADYSPRSPCTRHNNTVGLGPLVPPGIPICTDNIRQTGFSNTWNGDTVASKSKSKQGAGVLAPSGVLPGTTNNAYTLGSSSIHIFNPFDPIMKQLEDTRCLLPCSASLLTSIDTRKKVVSGEALQRCNPNVVNLKAQSSSREFQMTLAGVTITPCGDTLQVTIGMGERNEGYLNDIHKICLESTVLGDLLRLNITLQYGMWDMAEGHTVIRSIIGVARNFASSITATAPYGGSSCMPISTSIGSLPFRTSVWANDVIRPSLDEMYFAKLTSLTLDCSISMYDCLEVIYRARNLTELEVMSLRRCDSIMEHTYSQLGPREDVVSQVAMLSIASLEDLTPLFQQVQFHKLANLALIINSALWPRDLRVPWSGLLKVDLIGNLNWEISMRIREACSDKTQHHHATLDEMVVWHNTVYDGNTLGPQRVKNKTIYH